MSYRSLIWGLCSMAMMVAIVALWMSAVGPMITPHGAGPGVHPHAGSMANPELTTAPRSTFSAQPVHQKELVGLARASVLLVFVVLCLLLTITLIVTLRSLLLGPRGGKYGKATPYIDAWKLAGKRLNEKPPDDSA